LNGVVVQSCESTSLLAREYGSEGAEAAPHGFWVSSREQTGGRGRWGRQWESQRGNLFLSIILRPARPTSQEHWTWIPMLGAITTLEILKVRWPALRLTLKWPNDVWLDGKKAGGLLCESIAASGQNTYLVLGLGLNLASAPKGLDQETACLADVMSDLDVEAELARLRDEVSAKVAQAVRRLEREGPVFVSEAFWRHAHFKVGDSICWARDQSPQGDMQGVVEGLGSFGELWVIADKKRVALYAEEIRGLRSAGG